MTNQSPYHRAATISRCRRVPGCRRALQQGDPPVLLARTIRDEHQYLRILRGLLPGRIPQHDLDEILADLSDHFRMGRAAGRTEVELIQSLGSPGEIAREICLMHRVRPGMSFPGAPAAHR
jgi:hypothetical protein